MLQLQFSLSEPSASCLGFFNHFLCHFLLLLHHQGSRTSFLSTHGRLLEEVDPMQSLPGTGTDGSNLDWDTWAVEGLCRGFRCCHCRWLSDRGFESHLQHSSELPVRLPCCPGEGLLPWHVPCPAVNWLLVFHLPLALLLGLPKETVIAFGVSIFPTPVSSSSSSLVPAHLAFLGRLVFSRLDDLCSAFSCRHKEQTCLIYGYFLSLYINKV